MKREIIPDFQHLPDRQAAEALSETILRPGDFKVTSDFTDFPPEPAHLTAACIAYLEDDTEALRVRRQLALPYGTRDADNIVPAYLDGYAKNVERWHEKADSPSTLPFNIGSLAVGAAQKAYEERLRTVAACILFSTEDGKQHFSGLVYPKRTYTDIPLEVREQLMDLMRYTRQSGYDSLADKTFDTEPLRAVMRNAPEHANFAAFSAAAHLPRLAEIKQGLSVYLRPQSPGDTGRLNRQQRRQINRRRF